MYHAVCRPTREQEREQKGGKRNSARDRRRYIGLRLWTRAPRFDDGSRTARDVCGGRPTRERWRQRPEASTARRRPLPPRAAIFRSVPEFAPVPSRRRLRKETRKSSELPAGAFSNENGGRRRSKRSAGRRPSPQTQTGRHQSCRF